MSTFGGCESHDFCIASVTLLPMKKGEKKNQKSLFIFFGNPREGGSCVGSFLELEDHIHVVVVLDILDVV
jgi:hypothetical protein